jgi:hypothetical protein
MKKPILSKTHREIRAIGQIGRAGYPAAAAWPLAAQDLVLGWWSIGSGGLGFNEQIFGADKQVPGRGQSD